MFKLLALRVLDGCAIHIRKCLKPNVYYYFCNDFRFEISGKVFRGSKYTKPLPESFFSPVHEEFTETSHKITPSVNIGAVVGMNGGGKSSIVELIIRLFNNHIARAKKGTRKSDPIYVSNVYAELYIQIDSAIYRLYDTKDNHGFQQIANIPDDFSVQSFPVKEVQAKDELFMSVYTLVSNYSLYAYNIHDFKHELTSPVGTIIDDEKSKTECWLSKLFHRKDGFRIPLLLYPDRIEGIIDVNTEAVLAKQRLLYLFVNPNDTTGAFRNILGKKAIGYWLKPSSTNKLLERTIINYFIAHKANDHSLEWAIDRIRKETEKISKSSTTKGNMIRPKLPDLYPIIENLYENEFLQIKELLDWLYNGSNFQGDKSLSYRNFLNYSLGAINIAPPKSSSTRRFVKCVDDLKSLINKLYPDYQVEAVESMFLSFIPYEYEQYAKYNICQIARLHTIFSLAVRYNIDTDILSKPYDMLTNKEQAQLYKIYKTISIFETYPNYTQISKDWNKHKWGCEACLDYTDGELSELLQLLKRDMIEQSHITRKLTQIDNYLKMGYDLYDSFDLDTTYQHENAKIKALSSIVDYYGAKNVDLYHLIPPIFEYDIIFQDGTSFMDMESLSSGEKQLLHNIGGIIYYLQSIDTAKTKYQSVNLFLEEIELYFHPEFQRILVNSILEQIYAITWRNIHNINITFVTHSPFILSDIPKNNVLFLKKGEPVYEMQENTYGANIHSLLKNGFFLPNLPMGEFAYQKINELFRQLNNDFNPSAENIEQIKNEITIVGEPYLREQLYKLLRIQQLAQPYDLH